MPRWRMPRGAAEDVPTMDTDRTRAGDEAEVQTITSLLIISNNKRADRLPVMNHSPRPVGEGGEGSTM